MIELNSAVHLRHDGLLQNLRELRNVMVEKAQLLNIHIAGGGSHPFQQWSDQRIFAGERYQAIWQKYGYLAKQFTVFGQQVHVGSWHHGTARVDYRGAQWDAVIADPNQGSAPGQYKIVAIRGSTLVLAPLHQGA